MKYLIILLLAFPVYGQSCKDTAPQREAFAALPKIEQPTDEK